VETAVHADNLKATGLAFHDAHGTFGGFAAGGEEAMELFRTHPVQLVLIDHRMEDMNGDIITVIITPQTRVSPRTDIKENNKVMVLGEINNGTIEALGIREIDIDNEFFPSRRMPGKEMRPFMK